MKKTEGLLGNLAWKFAERISAQLISMVVSIILARLLDPSHYGIISIVLIFITLANVLVSDGLGSALVQKKNASAVDFYSVLYFNIVFSVLLYLLLYFTAPLITAFYGKGYEILMPVLRVLGLRIILTAINSVQQAYISKYMMFRKFFISTLFGTIASAVVGIAMAYNGYGVWALVAQHLTETTVGTIILLFTLGKKPRCRFSFKSIKTLFPFGMQVLGTGLLITGYQELRALIIGKLYSSSDLAYYSKGEQFPKLIVNNVTSSMGAVLFPKMSNEQNDRRKIKKTMKRSVTFSSYVIAPLLCGFAAVAEPFVRLLLTDKWIACVPMLRLSCIIFLFQPIHSANMQAIKAIGRGDLYIQLELVKKIIELAVLICLVKISVTAIMIGSAVCATLFTFVNAYPNKKLLNYGIREQLSDILPNLLMACIMFVVVWRIGMLPIADLPLICIQIVLGATVYLLLSVVTQNREFAFIKNLLLGRLKKRKNIQ